MPELLTADEHRAVDLLGEVANLLGRVVGGGPTRAEDLSELITPIHVVQQAVLSQAAARAYPGRYRLLGATLAESSEVPADA